MKPIINYISLVGGRCGLTTESKREVLARCGSENVVATEPATQEQVDWIRAMGGKVPDGRVVKRKKEPA
jgi:hypothetical protein